MKETGLMPALAVEAAAEDVRRDLVGGLSMVNARTGGGVCLARWRAILSCLFTH